MTCPDCGRPRSLRVGDCQDTHNCIDYLKSELSALRLEVAAWRALAEWPSTRERHVSFPFKNIHGRWFCEAWERIGLSDDFRIRKDACAATPQAAVLELARKLQLIPAEPDESREGRER